MQGFANHHPLEELVLVPAAESRRKQGARGAQPPSIHMQYTFKTSVPKAKAALPGVETLLPLLSDPDECVSSLALEQLSSLPEAEEIVNRNQDTDDLLFRKRIHQLGKMLEQRKLFDKFVRGYQRCHLDPWEALVLVDKLYDPKSSSLYVKELSMQIFEQYPAHGRTDMETLADFLRCQGLAAAQPPWLSAAFYLLGDILENYQGAPLPLCILAREIARQHGFLTAISLHAGRFCLFDGVSTMINPMEDWKFIKNVKPSDFHVCSPGEVIRLLLSQLVATSTMLWDCYDVHLFSRLYQAINQIPGHPMPYPMGDMDIPGGKKNAN